MIPLLRLAIIIVALAKPWISAFTPAPSSVSRATCRNSLSFLRQYGDDDYSSSYQDRNTSYISQVSARDLFERRQLRRPGDRAARRRLLDQRRVASRGPGPNPQQMRYPQYEYEDFQPVQPPPPSRPMSPMQQQPLQPQPTAQQPQPPPMQTMDEGIDTFKDGVSSNLKAMTDLLKDMKKSQGLQSEEVEALADKVEDIAERLSESKRRRGKKKDRTDQSKFGRSLDGEFHQKIKDVIDEFEFDANRDDEDEVPEYYKNKVLGLESKIDRMGEALELVLSNRRLEDMNEEMFAENSGRYQYDHPIPPPPPQMSQDEMVDQQLPPQFQPPPEMMDDPYFDDGTRYYDNVNERDAAYSRGMSPGSATSVRYSRPETSANDSSGGFHYKGANKSFISAFSKMDNEKRKEFRPWMDDRRRRNDQLPRGVNPEESQRPPSMGRGFNNVPMPPPGGIPEDGYALFDNGPFDEFGMFGY